MGITRHELGAGDLRREARRCRDGRPPGGCSPWRWCWRGPRARRRRGRPAWTGRRSGTGCTATMPRASPLRDRPRSVRKPRLTPEQEAELAAAVERGPDPDRDGVVRWRRVDLQLDRGAVRGPAARALGRQGLRRLGFARLSVRPKHPKADEAAQEAFKKASPSWWRSCPSTPAASRSRSGFKMRPVSASRAP